MFVLAVLLQIHFQIRMKQLRHPARPVGTCLPAPRQKTAAAIEAEVCLQDEHEVQAGSTAPSCTTSLEPAAPWVSPQFWFWVTIAFQHCPAAAPEGFHLSSLPLLLPAINTHIQLPRDASHTHPFFPLAHFSSR